MQRYNKQSWFMGSENQKLEKEKTTEYLWIRSTLLFHVRRKTCLKKLCENFSDSAVSPLLNSIDKGQKQRVDGKLHTSFSTNSTNAHHACPWTLSTVLELCVTVWCGEQPSIRRSRLKTRSSFTCDLSQDFYPFFLNQRWKASALISPSSPQRIKEFECNESLYDLHQPAPRIWRI